MITVRDLTFQYEGARAPVLNGVSFSLQEGEVGLLLGPGGSGKSTLLLCLNGIIPHRVEGALSGQVTVAGIDIAVHPVPRLAEHVGLVFQNPESQFCMLTVIDEAAFGLENLRYPRPVIRRRVQEALRLVGLAHKEETPLDRLSGGEMQKVALASVLAMEPQLLLFDAPTANLDPVAARDFYALLSRLKREIGKTILLVEQQLDAVIDMVDRILLLDKHGQLVMNGSPVELLESLSLETLHRYGVWTPQVWELIDVAQRQQGVESGYVHTVEATYRQLRPFLNGRNQTTPSQLEEQREEKGACVLSVTNLSFHYPKSEKPALNHVDLALYTGDFCALVGQNGAGKTTLVKQMMGILRPPPGTIFLNGQDVTTLPPATLTRHIGYVFQNPEHQFVTDTVYDELAYGWRIRGLDEQDVAEKVRDMLALFALEPLAGAHPFSLSQSQKRRLSLGTVLVMEPQILILDEPTLGLDRTAAAQLMDLLRRLNRQGKTILFITHDMRLTAEYARSVAVMAGGVVTFQGTPRALFERPDVMQQANLLPPPLVALGWQARQETPGYPLAITLSEFQEQLCFSTSR